MSIEEQLTLEEAQAIIRNGLGRYELELVTSYCAPLYWAIREDGIVYSRNGTAFFLDAGDGVFGVTASHVIEGWNASKAVSDAGPLRLAGNGRSVSLDWDARVIDAHDVLDIATFRVTTEEVRSLGKQVLTGFQKQWPPDPPQERKTFAIRRVIPFGLDRHALIDVKTWSVDDDRDIDISAGLSFPTSTTLVRKILGVNFDVHP